MIPLTLNLEAVNAGVIPTNLDDVYNEGVC